MTDDSPPPPHKTSGSQSSSTQPSQASGPSSTPDSSAAGQGQSNTSQNGASSPPIFKPPSKFHRTVYRVTRKVEHGSNIALDLAPDVGTVFGPIVAVSASAVKQAKDIIVNTEKRHIAFSQLDIFERQLHAPSTGDPDKDRQTKETAMGVVMDWTFDLNGHARPKDIEETRNILNSDLQANENLRNMLEGQLKELEKQEKLAREVLHMPHDPEQLTSVGDPSAKKKVVADFVPSHPNPVLSALTGLKHAVEKQVASGDITAKIRQEIARHRQPSSFNDPRDDSREHEVVRKDSRRVIDEIDKMDKATRGMSDNDRIAYQDRFIIRAEKSVSITDKQVAVLILAKRRDQIKEDTIMLAKATVDLTGYDYPDLKDPKAPDFYAPPRVVTRNPLPWDPEHERTLYAPNDTYGRQVQRLVDLARQYTAFKPNDKKVRVNEHVFNEGPLPTPETPAKQLNQNDKSSKLMTPK